MHPDRYDTHYIDDPEDDDDDLDDDEDVYDGLSDYDEDDIVRSRGYARHYSAVGDEGTASCVEGRRQRSTSEGNMMLLEPSEDNRRDHHNQLERKRRASIKTSYNDLREVIPNLRGSKASRAVILQRAVECIEELVKLNQDHTHCVETLKRQNDLLDSRVQELQRLVHRMDGEEACTNVNVNCGAGSHCTTSNVGLRLVANSTNNNISMYHYAPLDAPFPAVTEDLTVSTGSAVQTLPPKATANPSSNTTQSFSATVASYTAANIVNCDNSSIPVISSTSVTELNTTDAIGACSPTVSVSNGSSVGPIRSISQRSSPSGMSSSSSSNRNEEDQLSFRTQETTTTVASDVYSVVKQIPAQVSSNSDSNPSSVAVRFSERSKRRKLK